MLMPLKKASERKYPLSWERIEKDDTEGTVPWQEFRNWLLDQGAQATGPKGLRVDYGKPGTVDFNGGTENEERCDCISLDMHAHWSKALEAYNYMLSLEQDCAVFDLQTGIYYDARTFEQFVAETYNQPP